MGYVGRNKFAGRCEACAASVAANAGLYEKGVLCAVCALDLAPETAARFGIKPAPRPVVEWVVGDRAGHRDARGTGFDAVITVEAISVDPAPTLMGKPIPGRSGQVWLRGSDSMGRRCTLQASFCTKLKPVPAKG